MIWRKFFQETFLSGGGAFSLLVLVFGFLGQMSLALISEF
jgi:hypothetical protein